MAVDSRRRATPKTDPAARADGPPRRPCPARAVRDPVVVGALRRPGAARPRIRRFPALVAPSLRSRKPGPRRRGRRRVAAAARAMALAARRARRADRQAHRRREPPPWCSTCSSPSRSEPPPRRRKATVCLRRRSGAASSCSAWPSPSRARSRRQGRVRLRRRRSASVLAAFTGALLPLARSASRRPASAP